MNIFSQPWNKHVLVAAVLLLVIGCRNSIPPAENSLLNFAHLEHLTRQAVMDGDTVALVLIYAEYPDYQPVEASGEGVACVDDVARAAVLYLRQYRFTGKTVYLQRVRKLLQFVLHLQARNGRFYNFVYRDLQINRTRHNSRPLADWWSWRAFWALSEALPAFSRHDPAFARQIEEAMGRFRPTLDSLAALFPQNDSTPNGFIIPRWLPHGAADQGSVLLLGLNAYLQHRRDSTLESYQEIFARGLLALQQGDSTRFPYGAFLSWQNVWHAWGNSQATALIQAARQLNQPEFFRRALREVKHFYPYLVKQGYLHQLELVRRNGQLGIGRVRRFEQIAYDIRPLVTASLEAYRTTGREAYARLAGRLACWLFGDNATGKALYDPTTGRCYDGIVNEKEINLNSGAESTIEALLILQAVEQCPPARQVVLEFLTSQTGKNKH